jgi:hypothetical protein
VGHFGAEYPFDLLQLGMGVLDDVVQQARGDADGIQPHVGQDAADLERVQQVRLARKAHLALVNPGRVDVGPVDQIQICLRVVAADPVNDVGDANHFGYLEPI